MSAGTITPHTHVGNASAGFPWKKIVTFLIIAVAQSCST